MHEVGRILVKGLQRADKPEPVQRGLGQFEFIDPGEIRLLLP